MSKPKFYYFDLNGGLGDIIRVTFLAGGVDFEDVRIPFGKAQGLYEQLGAARTMHQLPVLEVDGHLIGQSVAILQYAATRAHLMPTDPVAAAQVLDVIQSVNEVKDGILHSGGSDDEKRRKDRNVVNTETFPWVAAYLEQMLKANPSGYLVGSALTVADLYVALYMYQWLTQSGFFDYVRADLFEAFPALLALVHRVLALPAVSEYRKAHPRFCVRRLYYYDSLAGLADPIRLAFAVGGVPFEDVRIPFGQGDAYVANAPVGCFPYMEIFHGGAVQRVCQSNALTAYAAGIAGIVPHHDFERLRVDEVVMMVQDLFLGANGFTNVFQADSEDAKKAALGKWEQHAAPTLFGWLERTAQANAAHGYMVGSALTVADIVVFNALRFLQDVAPSYAGVTVTIPASPQLQAVAAKVGQDPAVVRYYAGLKK